MSQSEQLKPVASVFSGERVGYALASVSFACVSVHFFVSCEASVATGGIGLLIFLSAALLCLTVPKGTTLRFRPLAFALFGLLLHMLSTH